MAEQLLADCSCVHLRSATPAAVGQLRRASENYLRVVPHIHDLWSEQLFRRSSASGSNWSELPENQFLKPLADFTDVELRFEETLAAMDLRTLTIIADRMRIADEDSPLVSEMQWPDTFGEEQDVQVMIRALAGLATNEQYLRLAMNPIQENWARARRIHYLVGPGKSRHASLRDFDSDGLLANVRADILGVLLFSLGNDAPHR